MRVLFCRKPLTFAICFGFDRWVKENSKNSIQMRENEREEEAGDGESDNEVGEEVDNVDGESKRGEGGASNGGDAREQEDE